MLSRVVRQRRLQGELRRDGPETVAILKIILVAAWGVALVRQGQEVGGHKGNKW